MDAFKQLPPTLDGPLVPLVEGACCLNGMTIGDLVTLGTQGSRMVDQTASSLNVPPDAMSRSIQALERGLRITPRRFSLQIPVISSGIPSLDAYLNGGVPVGEVTEIVGAAGTGKLHFTMQLALQCQLVKTNDDVPGQCIYVTTEQALETRRLNAMLSNYKDSPVVLLDNIHHTYCSTPESMDHILYTQVPALLRQMTNAKLLIIDSIAQHIGQGGSLSHAHSLHEKIEAQQEAAGENSQYEHLQKENSVQLRRRLNRLYTYKRLQAKQEYLVRLHRHITMLAKTFQIAVVVVNHVSDLVSDGPGENSEGLDFELHQACHTGWDIGPLANRFTGEEFETEDHDEIGRHVACLGNTWGKRIANRILLAKFYKMNQCVQGIELSFQALPLNNSYDIPSKRKSDALGPDSDQHVPAPDRADRDLDGSENFYTTTRYIKVVSFGGQSMAMLSKIPVELGHSGLYTLTE